MIHVSAVFGHFPAELGPETHSDGSSSKDGAEHTLNKPRKTNYKAVSWKFPGLGQENLNLK